MGSEARTVELVVVSATDLKKVKKFGGSQQKCYVVAYIYAAQRQATNADDAGGVNPIWNAPLPLTCYETDLYPNGSGWGSTSSSSSSSPRAINIDIYARSSGYFGSGDKVVGTVVVPLQYIASAVQAENLTMIACDVRRPTSGKVQGKLNLTVKLGPKHAISGATAAHRQQMPSYAYHKSMVDNAGLVTSYSTVSREPSALAVYDPNLKSFGTQEVVTGYPSAGYGFAPLGAMPAAGYPQRPGQTPYVVETPVMTRRQKKQARRARRAADPARKAVRRKRMKMGALIVGGLILGMILL